MENSSTSSAQDIPSSESAAQPQADHAEAVGAEPPNRAAGSQEPGRRPDGSPMGDLPAPYDAPEPHLHCTIAQAPAVPTVVVAADDIPSFELNRVIDAVFRHLPHVLEESVLNVTGPAFLLHHRQPVDTASVEVGFPVDGVLAEPVDLGEGLVARASDLPEGRVAVRSHMGSYGTLADSWGSFVEDIGDSEEQMSFPFWEFYVSLPTPDADPRKLRTDMVTILEPRAH